MKKESRISYLHVYARTGIIGHAGESTSKAADLDWQDQVGKSISGIATPKAEIALVKQRLKEAYLHYERELSNEQANDRI
jgi:hypothetical protein